LLRRSAGLVHSRFAPLSLGPYFMTRPPTDGTTITATAPLYSRIASGQEATSKSGSSGTSVPTAFLPPPQPARTAKLMNAKTPRRKENRLPWRLGALAFILNVMCLAAR
jgi:hypothetical protein